MTTHELGRLLLDGEDYLIGGVICESDAWQVFPEVIRDRANAGWRPSIVGGLEAIPDPSAALDVDSQRGMRR